MTEELSLESLDARLSALEKVLVEAGELLERLAREDLKYFTPTTSNTRREGT